MSTVSTLPLPAVRSRSTPAVLRSLLLCGCLVAAVAALMIGDPSAYQQADPALAHLLRGMALIKAGMVSAAIAVLLWRFGRPTAPRVALAYLVGAWLLAGATAMIWQLSHIGAAAIAFHAGEIGMLVVAWRGDRGEWLPRSREAARRDPLAGI